MAKAYIEERRYDILDRISIAIFLAIVLWAISEKVGPLEHGFDVIYGGNLPIGVGLSSSASLPASPCLSWTWPQQMP